MSSGRTVRCNLTLVLLFLAGCGASSQKSSNPPDGSSSAEVLDGGQTTDGSRSAIDAMGVGACVLPAAPADPCTALPTGKVSPCSVDGGQPSQTGYLQIDIPGGGPAYVCATSWSADPSVGYIFGQPATFLSDPQGCCGGMVTPTAAPMVPDAGVGTLGAPHIPSHVKPQEITESDQGPLRQNPFAVIVTDAKSGAAATQAIATWLSWGGDGTAHPAPDGTGAYYFASGFPVNYVILETAEGFPVIVIGPEVSLTADGKSPIGHPTLGVCPAGGGAALAMIGGEIHGTQLNNHSGRYDYGPWVTAQALADAAQLFNCFGIPITDTKFYPPKS